jgi:hypothetical protein
MSWPVNYSAAPAMLDHLPGFADAVVCTAVQDDDVAAGSRH